MNTIYDTVIDQIKGVKHQPAAETFPAAIQALQSGAVDGVVSDTALKDQLEKGLAAISTDERNQLMEAAVERQPANN